MLFLEKHKNPNLKNQIPFFFFLPLLPLLLLTPISFLAVSIAGFWRVFFFFFFFFYFYMQMGGGMPTV